MISLRTFKIALILTAFILQGFYTRAQDDIILKKHTAPVKAVAFSNDDRILATGGDDKIICLWDVQSGELRNTIKSVFPVKAIVFAGNDKILAACGDDVLLFDFEGNILRTFSGYTTEIWSIAYNEEARILTAGSYAKAVRVWNFDDARQIMVLNGHEKSCLSVAISPSGKTIATGSLDRTVRLWDASTGRQLNSHEIHADNIFALAFHPSGKYLASSSADKTIRLWNVESGKIVKTYTGHEGAVMDVRFSPNGLHMLSGDSRNRVILWETASGKKIGIFGNHQGAVNAVGLNSDGTGFASGSDDHNVIYHKPDRKIFLTGSWYEKEIEKEVSVNRLFESKKENESRQEYDARSAKAESVLDSLYELNFKQYLETLSNLSIE